MLRVLALLLLLAACGPALAGACRGTLYLTLDTGTMAHAEAIAATLKRHDVRATFFLANERTARGDHALDASWSGYWRERVREGHRFGSHTWRHGKALGDAPRGHVRYRPEAPAGPVETLSSDAYCRELRRVDDAFRELTGRALDPLWRAPGGRTTPNALAAATSCGYAHVGWSPAGFLGDELPSETHPNRVLVDRAVATLRDGDVLMMHLGIRSRRDPYAPMLDELLGRLKARGFCFAAVPVTRS
ncbi:MAG: peptidase A8 [Betaproteobacteria bacterium]|nr:MAG: peptidase A8 [Betaproteobacteria bacterium]